MKLFLSEIRRHKFLEGSSFKKSRVLSNLDNINIFKRYQMAIYVSLKERDISNQTLSS